ncbi:DUF2442 domain-containing protein [Paraburkholderia sediminicola]|uniref:DUF2442 domain-containing protein n=1 Tax=Paraburkholderia rhynchosiae TaxID=487049 RepID=A0ACC7NEK8_9BURK
MVTRALGVSFADDSFTVQLSDGRSLTVPLNDFPKLATATPAQRQRFRIGPSGLGLHWPALDEDISVAALIRGVGDLTSKSRR